jgi:hypothetical protein
MRIRSSIKLLLAAAGLAALVLALAPVSFAGEDPGPTQAGEVQAAPTQSPADSQGPSHGTLAVTTSVAKKSKSGGSAKQDTVNAVGGIQTGAGGMAVPGFSAAVALGLVGGGALLLAAGTGGAALRRRAEG